MGVDLGWWRRTPCLVTLVGLTPDRPSTRDSAPMPRYFLDLAENDAPIRWDPFAGPRPERKDTRYWGGVFRAMERTIRDRRIDVYLTFDPEKLPRYGETVVAVILGDEVGRIPRYVDRVRAVFKCYGTRPVLGTGPLRHPGMTGAAELAQYAVRWLRWLPGAAAHSRLVLGQALRGQSRAPAVSTVPLGTFNQLELPVIPPEDRTVDLFFAGSVEHHGSLSHRLLSAKVRSRREMVAALERLAGSHPHLRIDLRVTDGFKASEGSSSSNYSERLMAARICLAPRGTSVETYRLLEGLRYGCLVICERLPPHWFYERAPFRQLDRWEDLEAAVSPVLDDPVALHRAHSEALEWWRQCCSESAVGRFMADRLNGLAGRPARAPRALAVRTRGPAPP